MSMPNKILAFLNILVNSFISREHVCQQRVVEPIVTLVNITKPVPYTVMKNGLEQVIWQDELVWENQTKLEWSIREVCCEGYEGPINNCTAHCDYCPPHSYCAHPEECECNDGYAKNATSEKCHPVCTNCGANGYCLEPEKCACNEGYSRRTEEKILKCDKNCTETCSGNRSCLEQQECVCKEPAFLCDPICLVDCGEHSYCQLPNKCVCFSGYEDIQFNKTLSCKPSCSDCKYGDCIMPDVCQCWKDYVQVTTNNVTTCQPKTCASACECWQEDIEPEPQRASGNLRANKCLTICQEFSNSKGCLDLKFCRCNENPLKLLCHDKDPVNNAETIIKHYNCLGTGRALSIDIDLEEKLKTFEEYYKKENKSKTVDFWQMLLVFALIALVGLAILGVLMIISRC